MMGKMRIAIAELDEAEQEFFTERRIDAMRAVFEEMDADNGLTLDMVELCPFFNYVFFLRFGKILTQSEQEKLYYILDTDMNNELGIPIASSFSFLSIRTSVPDGHFVCLEGSSISLSAKYTYE